jgi:hypothetical protein
MWFLTAFVWQEALIICTAVERWTASGKSLLYPSDGYGLRNTSLVGVHPTCMAWRSQIVFSKELKLPSTR